MQNLLRDNAERNMSNGSEWHLVKEMRESKLSTNKDDSPKLFEKTFLKRDDGLMVERMSVGRPEEKTETFLFKGNFGEFTIKASRWDVDKLIPLDTYTVILFNYVGEDIVKLALCHLEDIESALINYPPFPLYEYNARDVVFQVGNVKSHKTIREGGNY